MGTDRPSFSEVQSWGGKEAQYKAERRGPSNLAEIRGISTNGYNLSGREHAHVHGTDSVILRRPGSVQSSRFSGAPMGAGQDLAQKDSGVWD